MPKLTFDTKEVCKIVEEHVEGLEAFPNKRIEARIIEETAKGPLIQVTVSEREVNPGY